MARNQVEDAYERALRDPLFLDAVRGAHVGRWNVLDALWWESHPADTAPSGVAAPAARLRDLQRRLFSAGGDAVGDASVADAAQQLEAEIATERVAIRDAIARASSGAVMPSGAVAEVAHLFRPAEGGPVDASASMPVPPAPAAPSAAQKRSLAVLFSVIGALIAGVVVGIQLSDGTADASSPAPAPTPTVTLEIGPLPPVGIFDRFQTPEDVPTVVFPRNFDATSFRLLGEALQNEGDHQAIYAAKTTSNMVCLVVVPNDPAYVYTCALEADFPATGLRVNWAGDVPIESGTGETLSARIERAVVWNIDGSLEWGSTGT